MHAMAGTGRVIAGRYRLKDPIGRGAMGTVWRGWDEILDREVAVKELRISDGLPEDERAKAYQRTHREARTAARLSHPGLVTVFDVAEEDGRPWIVMELVHARSLDQVISRDGPLAPARAAEAGRQLLAALAAAHAAGVLHRDVKPSNVLLAAGGRAVLTDFGIATFQGDPRLTQTGMVMGSPGFTAPERIQGHPATPASDLWSLGATLYAALEGRGPFDQAGGAITTMSAIINTDPPPAPAAVGLGPVIDALLRRNPAERPDAATAARMLGAIGPLPGRTMSAGHRDESPQAGTPAAAAAPAPAPAVEPSAPAPAVRAPAPAVPGPAAPATAVDLPSQEDHTVPADLPEARRPFTEPPPPASGPDAGSPSPAAPLVPPAPRAGSAPAGWATPPAPGAGPGGWAVPSPSVAPAGDPAITGAVPPLPGTVVTGPSRRRTTARTALVALGVVVVLAAVAAGVLALRAHQQATLANRAAPAPAAKTQTARTPVTAAAGTASTGPLPAGWHWYTRTAAAAGTNAGFTLAIPDSWQVSNRGSGYYFEAPGGDTFLQVDLTPHTKSPMVAEAKYLALLTQKQGKFPDYAGQSIRAADIRNTPGAAWSFTWQDPTLGRVRALDLMYIANTPAGDQSFALYMSAPSAAFSGSLATFTEEMRTFRPVP